MSRESSQRLTARQGWHPGWVNTVGTGIMTCPSSSRPRGPSSSRSCVGGMPQSRCRLLGDVDDLVLLLVLDRRKAEERPDVIEEQPMLLPREDTLRRATQADKVSECGTLGAVIRNGRSDRAGIVPGTRGEHVAVALTHEMNPFESAVRWADLDSIHALPLGVSWYFFVPDVITCPSAIRSARVRMTSGFSTPATCVLMSVSETSVVKSPMPEWISWAAVRTSMRFCSMRGFLSDSTSAVAETTAERPTAARWNGRGPGASPSRIFVTSSSLPPLAPSRTCRTKS